MVLRMSLFFLLYSVSAAPNNPDHRSLVPVSSHDRSVHLPAAPRQSSPVNAALTGLFSPPFIVLVGMGALAHTVERFVTDMWRYTSQRNVIRRRKKKKKPPQEPIKPFPPLEIAQPPPPPPPPPVVENPAEDETEDVQETDPPTRYKWRYR